MPKDPRPKNKEWEKDRRNRLNEAFLAISKLLPSYDPSVNLSKIEILTKAKILIENLQSELKELISKESNTESIQKIKSNEYKKLYDRVRLLLLKNEQLCAILHEAKITIPQGCCFVKKGSKFVFSKTKQQEKETQKKDDEKENTNIGKKLNSCKFSNKKSKLNGAPKHRKAIINRTDKAIKVQKKKKKSPNKCLIVLSQSNSTPPCYIITNAPSNNVLSGTSTIITNTGLITSPAVSTKPSSLGAGTLILANGTIMPVLPTQIITRPPSIILLPKNPTTISVTSTVSSCATTQKTSGTTGKTFTKIKPKFCLTKTTQVNKVPIPALTSRYSNPEVVLKKSVVVKSKPLKNVTVEKKSVEAEKTEPEKRKEPPMEEKNESKKQKTEEVITEVIVSKADEKKVEKPIELNINHSELSNDIFASLQVPSGCQNPESTSPTAAFLLAFPLVSSLTGVKVTEVTEDDNVDSQRGTPTLLQIGTMDTTKPTQSENLNTNLLNLDQLFSGKDISDNFYNFGNEKSKDDTAKNVISKNEMACFNDNFSGGTTAITQTNFQSTTKSTSYYESIKSYPEPLYTNSTTYNNSSTDVCYYKDITKSSVSRNYYSLNYENYVDYRKNETSSNKLLSANYYNNQNKKVAPVQNRPPVNWMTSSQNDSDYYSNNQYFNTNYQDTQDSRLPLVPPVNSYQRNDDDNQFSWSPTKMPQFLDPAHSFVSSTLPTLVGDLALTYGDKCHKKENRKMKCENQNNFLSVSQLVEFNKEVVPGRTSTRRNSGGRSSGKKVPTQLQKSTNQRKEKEERKQSCDLFCDSPQKNRNKSSYSAEALIGQNRSQNYPNKSMTVSSFLHDNIIPYFPAVDLPQDNSFIQQNHQTTSYTYPTNTFIPSTSTYNFMHDVTSHDYPDNLNLFPPITKDKTCNKSNSLKNQACSLTPPKKAKRKQSELPNFVDFPFLSMPSSSINSPILPDDFHTPFLQPNFCKNPFTKTNDNLLPLPRGNIQHPEISPSVGTSLTNFNLSTIFPEITNKTDSYIDPRGKNYSSTAQVPFNEKSTFGFSYMNATTQSFTSNQ